MILRHKSKDTGRNEIIRCIEEVKKEIAGNEVLFNLTSSPELIDYAIYKDRSLRAHFAYLLKKYKEEEGKI